MLAFQGNSCLESVTKPPLVPESENIGYHGNNLTRGYLIPCLYIACSQVYTGKDKLCEDFLDNHCVSLENFQV